MSIPSRIRGWVATARALAGTHTGQQVGRFVRVAGLAALVGWIDGGRVFSWASLSAAVVGGVEVSYRQWRQTVAAGEPSSEDVPEPAPVESPADPAAPVPEIPETVPVADPSQGL